MSLIEGENKPRPDGERFFTAPLVVIFATVFIDLVGFGMIIPILPFYAEKAPFNATPLEIGLLFSIYSWMQFFFSPVLGRLSDRYGRRAVLFVSLLGSAVGYLVLGVAGSLAVVFLGRIISGITGANISTAQAYIADVTTRENRAKGMALFGAAFGLGFILGPALAGILSKYGVHVPFYFAAVLSLTSALAVYFFLPESLSGSGGTMEHHSRGWLKPIVDALSHSEFGLVALTYFLQITAFSIMTYAFVLFTAYRFGYNAEQNGYLFAFVGIVSVISQGALFGRFVKRFGETRLVVAGCILMSASLFILPAVGPAAGGLAGLLGVCIMLSFGNALAAPSLTGLASVVSAEEEQGSALGIMQSGGSLARAVGPMLGGFLLNNPFDRIDEYTLYRTFWAASVIMVVALLAAAYFMGTFQKNGSNRAGNPE